MAYKQVKTMQHDSLESELRLFINSMNITFRLYKPRDILLSFNGGKDATVVLHLICTFVVALSKNQQNSVNLGTLLQTGRENHSFNSLSHLLPNILFIVQPNEFKEILDFVDYTEKLYGLNIKRIYLAQSKQSFKTALCSFLLEKNIKCTIEGSRSTDPNARNLDIFSTSSNSWPPFLRVSPILPWRYRSVWSFLLSNKFPYCSLYDEGYTSIGNKENTFQNPHLRTKDGFRPAYELHDETHERAGRLKKSW